MAILHWCDTCGGLQPHIRLEKEITKRRNEKLKCEPCCITAGLIDPPVVKIKGPICCGFYYSERYFSEQYKNDQLTQDIILASKKGDRNAASRVCEKMYERLQQEHIIEFNTIVPVPNYKSDNRCKAPFLAEVLATTIHEKTGRNIPFHDTQDVLVRVNPSNQDRKSMTEEERRRTTKENYKIAEKIKYNNIIQDKIILLIDDIHVTGSTIDSCTDLLLQNGAKQVIQLCAGKNKQKY